MESPEDESPGPAPRFTALKAESDHGAQPTSVPGKLGILSFFAFLGWIWDWSSSHIKSSEMEL